jgi:hypothetical protein
MIFVATENSLSLIHVTVQPVDIRCRFIVLLAAAACCGGVDGAARRGERALLSVLALAANVKHMTAPLR